MQDKTDTRVIQGMLAACLVGIGWLIIALERLEAGTQSIVTFTRPPIITRWTDVEGMQQELLIYPRPDESEEEVYERQREQLVRARTFFPPEGLPR